MHPSRSSHRPARLARLARTAAVSAVALGTLGAAAAPAGALPAFTTAPRSAPDPNPALPTQLWNVRAGNDGTFDRVVFDERFTPSGYSVRYVPRVYADPSGLPVPLAGRYFLQVSLPDTGTSAAAGHPTFVPTVLTPNLPEVRQVRKTGEFEGVVSFGIGLNRYRGFRVFRLSAPQRLVVDILH